MIEIYILIFFLALFVSEKLSKNYEMYGRWTNKTGTLKI
jgi:hypothetical protein